MSYRQIWFIGNAKQRVAWNHTSEIIAAVYNTVRDKKKKRDPFKGSDFHPLPEESHQPRRDRMDFERVPASTIGKMLGLI